MTTPLSSPPILQRATPTNKPLRALIGIASARRPAILSATIHHLTGLDLIDVPIVVCVPSIDDAADIGQQRGVEILTGHEGLTRQRNRILQATADRADIVIFFDDDFIPHKDFIAHMQAAFTQQQDIVIATGQVLADGILASGLTIQQAVERLSYTPAVSGRISRVYNAYGCNMAVRVSTTLNHHIRFDEELPLYGWLEDVDFSRAMACHGRSVRIDDAWGVHMGVRSGRQPGLKLGYSQICNPAYLARKGTLSPWRAVFQIIRNTAANIVGTVRGDTGIDRRGRLYGNVVAMRDLCLGRIDPGRILHLGSKRLHSGGAKPMRNGSTS